MRVCILDSYFLEIKYGYFDTKNETKMTTFKKMINLVKNGQNFANMRYRKVMLISAPKIAHVISFRALRVKS